MAEKKMKKIMCMTFLYIIALRNKTVSHTFLPWFDNVKGRLCQERLLRSRNFATMVMQHHTTLLYSRWLFYLLLMQWNSQNMPIKRKSWGLSSNHLEPPSEWRRRKIIQIRPELSQQLRHMWVSAQTQLHDNVVITRKFINVVPDGSHSF